MNTSNLETTPGSGVLLLAFLTFGRLASVVAGSLVFAFSSSASGENWVSFGRGADTQAYYDADSIRREGPLVQVWFKVVFREPKQVPGNGANAGKTFTTALMLKTIDCRSKTITSSGRYVIKGPTGEVLMDYDDPSLHKFVIPIPGSSEESLVNELCASSPSQVQPPPGGRESARKIVSGSGFVVARQGLVLTNSHVVQGCSAITVQAAGKPQFDARVLASDDQTDLALLSSTGQYSQAAAFRSAPGLRAGETVIALGFPLPGLLADDVIVSSGTINALSGVGNDSTRLQISAPVQPGSSGGPLLDSHALVVGVVVAKLDAGKVARALGDIPQNVNFAIKAGVARLFLEAQGIQPITATYAPVRSSQDVATVGRQFTVRVECVQ